MTLKRLTVLREARKWTRAELARRTNMGAASVGQIESGRYRPYPSQLAKLAAALEFADDPARLLDECEVVVNGESAP